MPLVSYRHFILYSEISLTFHNIKPVLLFCLPMTMENFLESFTFSPSCASDALRPTWKPCTYLFLFVSVYSSVGEVVFIYQIVHNFYFETEKLLVYIKYEVKSKVWSK